MIPIKIYRVALRYSEFSKDIFDDHLVIILQVPLVDEFLIINVYKVSNLPILHPALQKTFLFLVEGEKLAFSSDGACATIPSECDMLTSMFTRCLMC